MSVKRKIASRERKMSAVRKASRPVRDLRVVKAKKAATKKSKLKFDIGTAGTVDLSKEKNYIDQPKLNLACGKNPVEGYFGIDKVLIEGKVNAVVDLMIYPWPIKSNSAEDIFCSHFVEHIPHHTSVSFFKTALEKSQSFDVFKKLYFDYITEVPDDGLFAFMNELYRIMKVGATAKIICPYWSSMRCWQDPTHRRAIDEATFLYFNRKWRTDNGLDHYETTVNFDYEYGYAWPNDWAVKSEETKKFALEHYNNVIPDIQFLLTKRE